MARGVRSPYLGIFLAFVCALVFFPVLTFQFVTGDDASHVTANPRLVGSLFDLWAAPYQVAGLYMPITYTAWWAATKASLGLSGAFQPWLFHGLNWAGHCANAALAFVCFRRVGLSALGAWLAGLIFALHPLQVESVAWVASFKDIFAGTFVLGSLWFALGDRWKLATACFILGVLAKPVAAVAPLIVGIFLWLDRRPWRISARWLGGWLGLSAAMLAWTKSLQPGPAFSAWERLRLAVDSLCFAGAKTLFPLGLSLNYGRSAEFVLARSGVMGFVAIALVAALVWRWRAHRRLVAALGLFVVPWLPVSGAVSFFYQMYSTTADRYLYLSLLGPALLVGTLWDTGKVRAPLALGLPLALAWLTNSQLKHWQNNLTLYTRMAWIAPTAENQYRYAMTLVAAGERQKATEALRGAVALEPGNPSYANNLALLHAEQGEWELAEAELRSALARSPESSTLSSNLAVLEKRRLIESKSRREP